MISLDPNICILSTKLLKLGSYRDKASLLKYYFTLSSIFHGIMKELTEDRES